MDMDSDEMEIDESLLKRPLLSPALLFNTTILLAVAHAARAYGMNATSLDPDLATTLQRLGLFSAFAVFGLAIIRLIHRMGLRDDWIPFVAVNIGTVWTVNSTLLIGASQLFRRGHVDVAMEISFLIKMLIAGGIFIILLSLLAAFFVRQRLEATIWLPPQKLKRKSKPGARRAVAGRR